MMRHIAVLGATGQIGGATLEVVRRHPDRCRASVLVAYRHVEALTDLCALHRPDLAIIADPTLEAELGRRLTAAGVRCDVASGHSAIARACASSLCNIVVAAIPGTAGLDSSLAALHANKRLVLTNKASTVLAGPLLLQALTEGSGELICVDTELNAVYPCLPGGLQNTDHGSLRRLILTASGGPFLGHRRADLIAVTPEQICKHPNNGARRRALVDSATLMSNGLAAIEAHHLFRTPPEQIEVRIHPQGQLHSFVEYVDGSTLARFGQPDLLTAISCELAWPDRIDGTSAQDLARCSPLPLERPDTETFRCLPLAFQALRAGGDAPAILNVANEVAVEAFLAGALPFLSIADVIEQVLMELPPQAVVDIQTLSERDRTARAAARQVLRNAC